MARWSSRPWLRRRRRPTPNKGDTAWMLTATVLVLLMTIPGLALFYGGLVRTKNMLSMLMQVFYTVCVVCIIWVLYGYSMAFTEGATYNSLLRRLRQGVSRRRDTEVERGDIHRTVSSSRNSPSSASR